MKLGRRGFLKGVATASAGTLIVQAKPEEVAAFGSGDVGVMHGNDAPPIDGPITLYDGRGRPVIHVTSFERTVSNPEWQDMTRFGDDYRSISVMSSEIHLRLEGIGILPFDDWWRP